MSGEARPAAWPASSISHMDDVSDSIASLERALAQGAAPGTSATPIDGGSPLRRVLDNLFVFVGVLLPDGRVIETNRAPLEAGGLTKDDVIGRPFWQTPWWTHDPLLVHWMEDAVRRVAAGDTVRRDVVARMAGDTRMDVDFMLAPLVDDRGTITHLIASGMDISARRDSERALARSEDRFRRAFEGASIGMGLVDAEGRLVLANESMARMFGYTQDELTGRSVHELVPQGHRGVHHQHLRDFMRHPTLRYMAKRQELFALRRDGSEFAVEIGLNPMPDSQGQQVLITINDVSERRAAQEQIERALKEKTALLNEVHHRVKNNLQVISSLLNLQARHADGLVRDALRDSQSRVHSMALMHQLLYERADFSALDMGPYLRQLVHLLRHTFMGASEQIQLAVEVPSGHPWRMDLSHAIPCGLVVTELVTNAIKHAFPEGRTGSISVRLGGRTDGVVDGSEAPPQPPGPWLEVADDGVGLPAGMDLSAARSLGFQLLPLLADQCGARLTLDSHSGTCARLTWPLDVEGDTHA